MTATSYKVKILGGGQTETPDEAEALEIAREWSEHYNVEVDVYGRPDDWDGLRDHIAHYKNGERR